MSSSADRNPSELSRWGEVDRALSDLAGALGTNARDTALNRWLDEAGAPTLDEIAHWQEWAA